FSCHHRGPRASSALCYRVRHGGGYVRTAGCGRTDPTHAVQAMMALPPFRGDRVYLIIKTITNIRINSFPFLCQELLMAAHKDVDVEETGRWLAALPSVLAREGPERAHFLLEPLIDEARRSGAHIPYSPVTAYIN